MHVSAVKPTQRGVVLVRKLGEVGAPPPLAASAERAVKIPFREEHPPHYMDAMLDIFPMLKSKNKTSPSLDGASTEGYT
jgi:hypothetical protein